MGTEIIVNGKKHVVGGTVTYEQLVQLAGEQGNPTITYCGKRRGDSRRSGTLYTGHPPLEVESEMIFEVIHTGNA